MNANAGSTICTSSGEMKTHPSFPTGELSLCTTIEAPALRLTASDHSIGLDGAAVAAAALAARTYRCSRSFRILFLFALTATNTYLSSQFHQADLTANQSWAHDMHEVVTQPQAQRLPIPQRQNIDSVSQYGTSRYASSQYAINQYASSQYAGSQYGGSQYGGSRAFPPVPAIPTCPPSLTPIDRSMSVEKPLGTVTVRVMFPPMKEPAVLEKFMVTQYTKLPDHRPPLRRDKAVVIDLPGHPRRQIFPAVDRSFIFIPRASRPNQQRTHGGRNRSVMGSFSGFSHRTSVFGGSYYNGSMYSPSVALSRRSSFAQDGGRDFIISPAASVISRPPHTMETTARPVVRLPPTAGLHTQPSYPIVGVQGPAMHTAPPSIVHPVDPVSSQYLQQPSGGRETTLPTDTRPIHQIQRESHLQPAQSAFQSSKPAENIQPYSSQPGEQASTQQPKQPSGTSSLSTVPLPQHHPLPQKPVFQENRPDNNLPMHQPRPQKTVSVENLETPVALGTNQPSESQPYSMAFHQQVPLPMTRGLPPTELHSRHSSYQSHTTGTPLPQIPERAIHAAPFQPIVPPNKRQMTYPHLNNMGAPSGAAYYGGAANAYVLEQAPQQGYYYPTPPSYPPNTISTASVSPYVPGGAPQASAPSYSQHSQAGTGTPLNSDPRKMVAQEVNGMVYYVDVSQLPAMSSYTGYGQVPMSQAGYMPNAGGMIAPVPAEGYYYEGQPSMAYY